MRLTRCRVLLRLLVALSSDALAATTWYVNRVTGSVKREHFRALILSRDMMIMLKPELTYEEL